MNHDVDAIFKAALDAVDPYAAVKNYIDRINTICREESLKKIYVVGLGKAAYPMTHALVDAMQDRIAEGIVVTKYGHAPDGPLSENITIYEAGHPVPDENGVAGTIRAVELLRKADRETLVVCLISGGGSALLVAPAEGLTLDDKQVMTRILLKGGADIVELNTVRKHLSRVKAGRLAEAASPARVLSLILSDVIGDPLDFIASGPTSPDTTTWADALAIVTRYDTAGEMPEKILQLLRDGPKGKIPDTPKKGNPLFDRVENIIIGSNRIATEAAGKKARVLGYEPVVLTTELQGEARDAARWLYRQVLESQPPGLRQEEDLPHCRGRNDSDCAGQGSRGTEHGNGPGLRHGDRRDIGYHVSLGGYRRDRRPHRCRGGRRRRADDTKGSSPRPRSTILSR